MMAGETHRRLPGDWRRRRGTKTDAHVYVKGSPRPRCGKAIDRPETVRVHFGRPCSDCMVNAIGGRDYGQPARDRVDSGS
jgi:hypothetical protein